MLRGGLLRDFRSAAGQCSKGTFLSHVGGMFPCCSGERGPLGEAAQNLKTCPVWTEAWQALGNFFWNCTGRSCQVPCAVNTTGL